MNPKSSKLRSFWKLIDGEGTPTDRANTAVLNRWSLIWALGIIAASWSIKFLDLPNTLNGLIALAPNVIALFVLRRYLVFLRMTDELLRRIHLEGLAIGFGVSYIFVIGYLIAEGAGAPPLNLTYLVLLMTTGWLVGNVTAMKRYR